MAGLDYFRVEVQAALGINRWIFRLISGTDETPIACHLRCLYYRIELFLILIQGLTDLRCPEVNRKVRSGHLLICSTWNIRVNPASSVAETHFKLFSLFEVSIGSNEPALDFNSFHGLPLSRKLDVQRNRNHRTNHHEYRAGVRHGCGAGFAAWVTSPGGGIEA